MKISNELLIFDDKKVFIIVSGKQSVVSVNQKRLI